MIPPVLTHPLLSGVTSVRHAFFTREGGVSEGLYQGLNVGRGSGDDPHAVAENRRRAAAVFGREEVDLLTCHQIHSAIAQVATAPLGEARPEGDAVETTKAGLICGVLTADCAPVLLADAHGGVVAAVHAGWKGALAGVVEAAVVAMEGEGARRERMVAVVGPCIGVASYEVGLEFLARFVSEDPSAGAFFHPGASDDKRRFDLTGYVLSRISRSGVGQADALGLDTYGEERFFSNRRAVHRQESDYGRLLSAIMLV